MAFCIQCGVQNPNDAVFCLGCGQPLFRPTGPYRRRWLLISSGALLLVILVAAALWFWDADSRVGSKAPPQANQRNQSESISASTLMIVAFDGKGSPFSQGSGFILTADGLAGSNYHVIKGAARAFASLPDGRVYEIGRVEGADLDKDLVVFQLYPRGTHVRPRDLSHVVLGSSSGLGVGERVIAIGSPQGLENTVSDGILSAVREVDGTRFLQITAPVSPGSSGGPVMNSTGQMIGVATFQFNKGQNLNFAVAADHLKPLLEEHLQLSFSDFQAMLARQAKGSVLKTAETKSSPDVAERLDHRSVTPNADYLLLTGQFGGVVHNQSANVSAQFAIFSNEEAGQLSGCMLVFQPLFGSGPLQGYVDGDTIVFSVTSSIGKITAWGRRAKAEISGTYVVEHGDSQSNEEGNFTLHRVNSNALPADFDSSNCPTDAEVHK